MKLINPQSPELIRRGLQISTVEGIFANFQYLLMQTAYLMGLGFLFGLSETMVSILASFTYLFQIFFFLNVWILQTGIDRKRWVIFLAAVSRTLWIIPAAVILFGTPQDYGWLFLLIFSFYFFLDKMLAHGWNSWMSDLVATGIRGKYFGFRQGINALVSAAFHFLIATILDTTKTAGNPDAGYAIVLLISVGFGFITLWLFNKQVHRTVSGIQPEPVNIVSFRVLLKDNSFTRETLISALGMASIGLVIMIIPIYIVDESGFSFSVFALYQTIILALGILSYQLFGRIIDEWGIRASLFTTLTGLLVSAIVWIFIDGSRLWLFYMDAILIGFFYSGFLLTNATISLGNPKDPSRNLRIAVYATTTGLFFFGGTLLGGALTESLTPIRADNIRFVFIVTVILRIFVVLLAYRHWKST